MDGYDRFHSTPERNTCMFRITLSDKIQVQLHVPTTTVFTHPRHLAFPLTVPPTTVVTYTFISYLFSSPDSWPSTDLRCLFRTAPSLRIWPVIISLGAVKSELQDSIRNRQTKISHTGSFRSSVLQFGSVGASRKLNVVFDFIISSDHPWSHVMVPVDSLGFATSA